MNANKKNLYLYRILILLSISTINGTDNWMDKIKKTILKNKKGIIFTLVTGTIATVVATAYYITNKHNINNQQTHLLNIEGIAEIKINNNSLGYGKPAEIKISDNLLGYGRPIVFGASTAYLAKKFFNKFTWSSSLPGQFIFAAAGIGVFLYGGKKTWDTAKDYYNYLEIKKNDPSMTKNYAAFLNEKYKTYNYNNLNAKIDFHLIYE